METDQHLFKVLENAENFFLIVPIKMHKKCKECN